MNLQRLAATTIATTIAAFGLVACSQESGDTTASNSASSDSGETTTVRIGTTDADQEAWNVFKDLAEQEGITLDIVQFSDYPPVNEALAQGEIDLNKYQHILYLAKYNASSGNDLKIVGSSEIYPLALFWKDHTSLDGIDGEEIAIPNDDSNQGRAINVLVQADLVTLKGGADELAPTPADIDTDQSKVSVVPVDAAQTPSAYKEGRPAIINNSWLERASIEPSEAIFQDDPASEQGEPYINVFAARAEDVDNPTYVRLAELWHDAAVTEAVQQDSRGTAVEVKRPADELNDILARLENNEK